MSDSAAVAVRSESCAGAARRPYWLRRPLPTAGKKTAVVAEIERNRLHTVCDEARCPNRAECFSRGCATFLVLGEICSRGCRFCSVSQGVCLPPDPDEPGKVARVARSLGLRHVVVTSVTRDDLDDGGSAHFVETLRALREQVADATVEVLVPDFQGNRESVDRVVDARPDVFNHNIETVPRLYRIVRPQADFRQSLAVLERAARCSALPVKSGLMLGLGETATEVEDALRALRSAGCTIVTLGQYLQPSSRQLPVVRYVEPVEFEQYRLLGNKLGFEQVLSAPFVRSSWHAEETLRAMGNKPR